MSRRKISLPAAYARPRTGGKRHATTADKKNLKKLFELKANGSEEEDISGLQCPGAEKMMGRF